MRDNQLFALIIQVINAQAANYNLTGIPIWQSNQETLQGVSSGPTLYMNKIGGDHRYGFPYNADIWDSDSETMVHTECQDYESTFQISALVPQNPATPEALTASDVANNCAALLQGSAAIQAFIAAGAALRRVTDVRNPAFIDDHQQWEYSPSFDIVITHKQRFTTTTPIIDETVINIYEV